MTLLKELLQAGLLSLQEYVAIHVLTCLVPAFLLAGAMVTLINREAIIDHLGEQANKLKSFSLAAVSGIILAACSCTAIPVASGLYYGGASAGVAFILLWTIPAVNILALIYTGNILGAEMLFSRLAAVFVMAFVVGGIIHLFFKREKEHIHSTAEQSSNKSLIGKKELVVIILILLSLLMPNYLVHGGPYWKQVLVWGVVTLLTILYAVKNLSREKIGDCLRETWWFVRVIVPLLLAGVFLVGVIGHLISEDWIKSWLGGEGLTQSFLATFLGAITYFATLTEAPFVDTFLKLGMGKGPALALLLTGPGLSLPNWLVIARVFGIKKSIVYVITIIILGTITGWFFGTFIF